MTNLINRLVDRILIVAVNLHEKRKCGQRVARDKAFAGLSASSAQLADMLDEQILAGALIDEIKNENEARTENK
jgi:hypothetical protein